MSERQKRSAVQILEERERRVEKITVDLLETALRYLRSGFSPTAAAEQAADMGGAVVRVVPDAEAAVLEAAENVRVIGECIRAQVVLGGEYSPGDMLPPEDNGGRKRKEADTAIGRSQ